MEAELILDARAQLGEGAIWHDEVLYWVDIEAGKVCVFDPAAGTNRELPVGQKVGTVVPCAEGGLAVALEHGFALLDPQSGELTMLVDPEEHLPRNRFNDGKCDPAGRFWAGTISMDGERGAASLYVLDVDGSVRKAFGGVSVSNGIIWSRDGETMYYIDTPTLQVEAFDYDVEAGQISNRRTIIDVPEELGHADGMTIDADGNLWVAMWGGWCVTCWNPGTGKLIEKFPVGSSRVSSCAFGGAGLDELFITTAGFDLTEEQRAAEPHAGGLFRLIPGVSGLPASEYRGVISPG